MNPTRATTQRAPLPQKHLGPVLALLALALPGLGQATGGEMPQQPDQPGSGNGGFGPSPEERGLGSTRGPVSSESDETLGSFAWHILWDVIQERYYERRLHAFGGTEAYRDDGFFLGRGEQQQEALSGRLIPPDVVAEQVIPLLEDALANDRSIDVQAAALLALGRAVRTQPDAARARTIQTIRPFLADSTRDVSEAATIALGLCAHFDAVVTLGGLVLDDAAGRASIGDNEVPYRQRAYAAYALGLAASDVPNPDVRRYAVQKLFAGLAADDGRWRDLEVACLIAIGMVPLEDDGGELPLEESKLSPSASLVGTLRALLTITQDESFDRLARGHAATALGRLVEPLPPPRREALAARLVPPLADVLGRGSRAPRELMQGAAWALGSLIDDDDDAASSEGRRALLRAFDLNEDILTHAFALVSLARSAARPGLGREPGSGAAVARRQLLSTLARGSSLLRPWSALAIGMLGHELLERGEEVPGELRLALRTALRQTESPEEGSAYAIAAGLIGDFAAEPLVRRYVTRSANVFLRGKGAVALGLLGALESLPALKEALQDSLRKPPLIEPIALGRTLLDDDTLVQDIEAALQADGSLDGRMALLFGLGRMGDSRALEALLRWSRPHAVSSELRAVAIAALGMLIEPDDLPWPARIGWQVNPYARTETLRGSGRGVLDAR